MTGAAKIAAARTLLDRHDAGLKVGSDPLWAALRAVTELAEAQENADFREAGAVRDQIIAEKVQEIAKLRAALAGLANALELPRKRGVLTLVPEALERARAALGSTP